MTQIGLLSDTHGHYDPRYAEHFASCHEIWHAGDVGSPAVLDPLREIATLRVVSGNIDGFDIRADWPQTQRFRVEGVEVLMQHIVGYPGRYAPGVSIQLKEERPQLLVAGHSHILKVMHCPRFDLLYMNPGAAGLSGFHQVRTLLRFQIDGTDIRNLQVIELGKMR